MDSECKASEDNEARSTSSSLSSSSPSSSSGRSSTGSRSLSSFSPSSSNTSSASVEDVELELEASKLHGSRGKKKKKNKKKEKIGRVLDVLLGVLLMLLCVVYISSPSVSLPSLAIPWMDSILQGKRKVEFSNVGFNFNPKLKSATSLSWGKFKDMLKKQNISRTTLGEGTRKVTISKHVTRPVMKNKLRTFGCLREGCRGLEIEDMLDRGWSMRFKSCIVNGTRDYKDINYHMTFLMADTTNLNHLQQVRSDLFDKIMVKYEGSTYLTAFDGGDAIGGNKGQQLRTKMRFAKNFQCKYNDLGIQPAQYRLYYKDECEDLQALDRRGSGLTWLLKPEAGSQGQGITFHSSIEGIRAKRPEFFPCRDQLEIPATKRVLVQEYIERPLLLEKCKFDVRVYMLVANSNPWMIFYHNGYLRRSLSPYSPNSKDRKVYLTNTHFQSMKTGFKLSDHIWPFETFQGYLSKEGITGAHYVDSILNPTIRAVSQYVFKSAVKKLKPRRGSYQIIGLDFMIDEDFHVHFIEANGYPGFTWSINFDSRRMIESLHDLVLEMNEQPEPFQLMRPGDRFAGWQLVSSEIYERTSGLRYNPCEEFNDNLALTAPMKAANKIYAKISGNHVRASVTAFDGSKDVYIPRIPGWRYLGGEKGDTFQVRRDYFHSQCGKDLAYTDLKIEPPTYLMYDESECLDFFSFTASSSKQFILKNVEGRGNGEGLVFFESSRDVKTNSALHPCIASRPEIWMAQESVRDTLRLDVVKLRKAEKIKLDFDDAETTKEKRKNAEAKASNIEYINPSNPLYDEAGLRDSFMVPYDIRAYMFVASVEPLMVFYHDGFLRSVRAKGLEDGFGFEIGEHVITFESFQYYLASQQITGPHYVSAVLRPYLMKVMEFAFHSAREQVSRLAKNISKTHHHQLFGLNFLLRHDFKVQLAGIAGDPGRASLLPIEVVSEVSEEVREILQKLQERRKELTLEIAASPAGFARMKYGDSYGSFKLIFSEMDEVRTQQQYDPCSTAFTYFGKGAFISANVLRKTANLQNFLEKQKASHKREMEKYVHKRWASCKLRSSREAKESCIRGELAFRYVVYLQKEREPFDPEFITERIHELQGAHSTPQLPKWKIEAARKRQST